MCAEVLTAGNHLLENDGASVAEPLLRRARQLSHRPDNSNCVMAVSADVIGERQGNRASALGEGGPVTGIAICQALGRRLIAHVGEKSTVRATENIESERLSGCVHLSPSSASIYEGVGRRQRAGGKAVSRCVWAGSQKTVRLLDCFGTEGGRAVRWHGTPIQVGDEATTAKTHTTPFSNDSGRALLGGV
jgi:hypothetical protein